MVALVQSKMLQGKISMFPTSTYSHQISSIKIPWIVKTDDDMINNIWKIGALVEALKDKKYNKSKVLKLINIIRYKFRNTITCSTKTERVIREKTGTRIDKWVIPYDEWPDEFFPTNCWGVVYIMSSLVRNKLLQVRFIILAKRQIRSHQDKLQSGVYLVNLKSICFVIWFYHQVIDIL